MTEYQPKSEFLRTIIERGFFHQCTDLEALDARLMRGDPVSAYIGFDATADSLHVGSLMQIMMLRWLQKCGHRPIVLMGGGTTKVGDPSGKDETRQLLDTGSINYNIGEIRKVFTAYIKFSDGVSEPTDAIQPDNAEWLDKLNYVEFLRDIGRHFTINRMMTMDSVKTRLEREQPLTFLEFNYMLLQSYDYLQLHQRAGCELQIGGSDQWGNIVNGVDLTRRVTGEQVFGLTSPLLTKADGSKMGKTADGAVWLNERKLDTFDFWQFWRNTMDEDVGRFLKLFTELPIEECERLGALQGQDINEAKIILATEACAMCHGRDKAKYAEEAARMVFTDGIMGQEVATFDIEQPIDLVQLLIKIKFATSGKDAKRLIKNRAVRINDNVITDPYCSISRRETGEVNLSASTNDIVSLADPMDDSVIAGLDPSFFEDKSGIIQISLGKKRHAWVELKINP